MSTHFNFGQRSLDRIETVSIDLELVLREALMISPFDFTVVCGARGQEAQESAFENGTSKTQWPDSKHNVADSDGNEIAGRCNAVDVAPWINGSIPWSDEGSFYVLAGVMMAASNIMNVPIRYGGDWSGEGLTEDQTFHDLGHYELLE